MYNNALYIINVDQTLECSTCTIKGIRTELHVFMQPSLTMVEYRLLRF